MSISSVPNTYTTRSIPHAAARRHADPDRHDGRRRLEWLTDDDRALLTHALGDFEDAEEWSSSLARGIAEQRRLGILMGPLTSIALRSTLGGEHLGDATLQRHWDHQYEQVSTALLARERATGPPRLDLRA